MDAKKEAKNLRKHIEDWLDAKSVKREETQSLLTKLEKLEKCDEKVNPNDLNIVREKLSKKRISAEDRKIAYDKIMQIAKDLENGNFYVKPKDVLKENIKEEESDIEVELNEPMEKENELKHNYEIILANKNINLEKIEKCYDSRIPKYQHDVENPMMYVGKYKNFYRMQLDGETFVSKKLDEVCEKTKNKIISKLEQRGMINITARPFKNYTTMFVSYTYDNIELFDIRHIIYILNIQKVSRKLNDYKKMIKYFAMVKNELEGYITKYLITTNDVKIIVSTSKCQYKKEIANALGFDTHDVCVMSKEISCLNFIRKIFDGIEMIHQFPCGTYRIDMYMPYYKIAIECDENNHDDRDKNYEQNREKYIMAELNCLFVRFNPDEENFDIQKVCNNILKIILKK